MSVFSTQRCKASGLEAWQKLTSEELREIVWSHPASHLQGVFGVSDRGIAKSCVRKGIARPPRGYWQKLNANKDPRLMLKVKQVRVPDRVWIDLALRFGPW
eukprot:GHVR01135310.1.p1 GENE.GHVR01135310.1~~GHVR01135310.1.p1  ORF type:complete len:109 (-),score=11.44 GHVR01135310.1:475-777(-)